MSKCFLFVYGTLKRRQRANHLLDGGRYLRKAQTTADFHLYDLGPYPVLIRAASGGSSIRGELWEVDDEILMLLDEYEGVDEGLYERTTITLADGSSAQSYLFCGSIPADSASGGEWPLPTS